MCCPLATGEDPAIASSTLQRSLDSMEKWFQKWGFKINEKKSSHVTFTLRKQTCPKVTINNTIIPSKDSVKYLGMTLDRRLTWKKTYLRKNKAIKGKTKKILLAHGPTLQTKHSEQNNPLQGRNKTCLVLRNPTMGNSK